MADARNAAAVFPHLCAAVSDVITSPPYLDTTNYHEDQWLRLWFLGGSAIVNHAGGDGRHYEAKRYWRFLTEAWRGLAPLLTQRARIVIRIGSRRLSTDAIREALAHSLEVGLDRTVCLTDAGISSTAKRTQTNAFRGSKRTPAAEHDFCFLVV
ncbi:MAG: hypothetical protein OXU81_13300 [Gammaproteobacteria bacterium]|nr:hypothetical protein [Gammaproteobacteria bacterium]